MKSVNFTIKSKTSFMTNKNTRQIPYEKSAGYRPDALGAFHSEKLQGKCKLC